MSGERYEDFLWALEAFKRVMGVSEIKIPNWIITDDCSALRKAINQQFSGVPLGLCQFHISRAIEAKIRAAFTKTGDLTDDDILEQKCEVQRFWHRVGLSEYLVDPSLKFSSSLY
jgi:MULE transposase domain